MPGHSIFYSWQSDLPNSINRGFIEDCLVRALKQISAAVELTLDPSLDRDTQGVVGAPDIAETIFAKIDAADVFVADVSFVSPRGVPRPTPNPNVLIELGYAARALGWESIVCVFNKASGGLAELPFDIRKRRIRTYELVGGQEKTAVRVSLVTALVADITAILHQPDRKEAKALRDLVSDLAPHLIAVMVLGSEIEDRLIDPWLSALRSEFEGIAEALRRCAVRDAAIRHSMAGALDGLADSLDEVAHFHLHLGCGEELSALVRSAADRSRELKEQRIDSLPHSADSIPAVRDLLAETNREMQSVARRAESMANSGRLADLQETASQLGRKVLQAGYYDLARIAPGLSDELQGIGRPLHLVETMTVFTDGGQSERAVIGRIKEAAEKLSDLVTRLNAGTQRKS